MKFSALSSKYVEKVVDVVTLAPGIAIGFPFFILKECDTQMDSSSIDIDDIDAEIEKYQKALTVSQYEFISLHNSVKESGESKDAEAILKSYIDIVKDPILTNGVVDSIRKDRKKAAYVFTSVMSKIEEMLSKTSNSLFAARVQDIQDVSRRVIGHLNETGDQNKYHFNESVIIFSDFLATTEIISASSKFVKAFVTSDGSFTSHAAIIARAKRIPLITGVDINYIKSLCFEGSITIIDGDSSQIIINPKISTISLFFGKVRIQDNIHSNKDMYSIQDVNTLDNANIKLSVNIDSIKDIDELIAVKAKVRIGLFRSEYLVCEKGEWPDEEFQVSVYSKLVKHFDSPVIRAFDFGSDKTLGLDLNIEDTDRGVRVLSKYTLERDIQIKAILRSTIHGKIKLMLPFVSCLEEIIEYKNRISIISNELRSLGYTVVQENLSFGCMIEVPAAVMIADKIAAECDFLSIGTNDLFQHTMVSSRVKYKDKSYIFNVAIARMIKMVIDNALKYNVPVSICGEIASNESIICIIIGLGIAEVSVSAPFLSKISNKISGMTIADAKAIAINYIESNNSSI